MDQVSVEYPSPDGPIVALEPLSVEFERGSFVCVVGPSGCGKTTLLQAIGGFIAPTTGVIRVNGRRIQGPGKDRGMVFQQPALFPWKSVFANAEFGPFIRGERADSRRAKVERYLKIV